MKLYELTGQYQEVWNRVEDETLDLDMLENCLESIEGAIEVKTANIVQFIRSLDADAEIIRAEEKRLSERRKALENRRDSIKCYLQNQMQLAGIEKIKTTIHTIQLQDNPPSLRVVDLDSIPDKFKVLVPEHYEIRDKKEITKAIQSGENVPGAELTRGKSLRIR